MADPSIDKSSPLVASDKLAQANKLYETGVLLIYGRKKSVDRAIKCVQKAITLIDTDYRYWQLLGEAYYQRGSLNPAINCLIKSIKLAEGDAIVAEYGEDKVTSDRTHCRLRMSDIRLSVGHLDEALVGYSDIITQSPDHVPALLGLSKTLFNFASSNFSAGLVKSGHDYCMKALEHSIRAIKLSPQLCDTWKTASDCCLLQFIHGQKGVFKTKLVEDLPGAEGQELFLSKQSCIDLAQQFLCKALSIEDFEQSGCLWHNLGVSLFLKSTLINDLGERSELLERSLKCLLKSLEIDPENSQIKNSIGIVLFHLGLLKSAQNFLIRSIQTNRTTSEMQFSNLGYMYLQQGDHRLASTAFARSQAEEPVYPRSWLGSSLVNEQTNVDHLSHLRQCQRLDCNYESYMMFATKVLSLPQTKVHLIDTINAIDCMMKVINYDEESIEANTALGLLYERSGNYQEARRYFNAAYSSGPKNSKVIFNKLRQHSAQDDCCTDPLACEPTNEFIKEAEKLTHSSNKGYLLNYIYYLFKNGDHRNLERKVTNYMDKLSNNDLDKKISAQILLGLAARADGKDFKSWLFKNVIDSENFDCIESLVNSLCLMIFGSAISEKELVNQATNDLKKRSWTYLLGSSATFQDILRSKDGLWIRLGLFYSIFCSVDPAKLIRTILAMFPTTAELWLFYGLAFMMSKRNDHAIACIERAGYLNSESAETNLACYLLMALLMPKAPNKTNCKQRHRLRYLCKAVYYSPNNAALRQLLMACSKGCQRASEREDDICLLEIAIDHLLSTIVV